MVEKVFKATGHELVWADLTVPMPEKGKGGEKKQKKGK